MITKINKNAIRQKRHLRVRNKISGTAEKPRFNVYRSTNHINVQIIDDVKQVTLVSCSTLDKDLAKKVAKLTKVEAAKLDPIDWLNYIVEISGAYMDQYFSMVHYNVA